LVLSLLVLDHFCEAPEFVILVLKLSLQLDDLLVLLVLDFPNLVVLLLILLCFLNFECLLLLPHILDGLLSLLKIFVELASLGFLIFDFFHDGLVVVPIVLFLPFILPLLLEPFVFELALDFLLLLEKFVIFVHLVVFLFQLYLLLDLRFLVVNSLVFLGLTLGQIVPLLNLGLLYNLVALILHLRFLPLELLIHLSTQLSELLPKLIPDLGLFVLKLAEIQLVSFVLQIPIILQPLLEALLDGLLLLLYIFIVVKPLVLHLFAEVVFKIIFLFLQLRGECFRPEQVNMLVDVHGLLHQLGVLVDDPLFLEF